jgi:hypothetical protein
MPAAPPAPGEKLRTYGVLLVALLLVASVLHSLFGHHENAYEHVADEVTVALQHDDVAVVKRFQNAETATHVTAALVGRGADTFAPLGALKSVKETSADADTRVHQFDLTFEKGTVHETIRFDPDGKVVNFRYDEPTLP